MMKPVEAIERMRAHAGAGDEFWSPPSRNDFITILAYLDAWPKDLDKARMLELADGLYPPAGAIADALRRLAELAPTREKRKVNLWHFQGWSPDHLEAHSVEWVPCDPRNWTKRGEAEIDA